MTGFNSPKAVKVEITAYTTGDAKWFFNEVAVTPGKTYEFSDHYISDISSVVLVRYTLSNGTFIYKDIAHPVPSATFKKVTVQDVAPAGAISATVFHLIKQIGFLTTDAFTFSEITVTTEPPAPSTGFVPNSNFEQTTDGINPVGWKRGGFGTNTRSFSYPVSGPDGTKAAQVNMSSYTSGDAKWAFDPIVLSPGFYTYTDQYNSNINSTLTLQLKNVNGSFTYKNIAVYAPTTGFKTATVNFEVPEGTQNVTLFHLIQGVGFLTLDNVVIQKKAVASGVFTTGAVSFRFDDGWLSQYEHAVPKLNSAGFKGTFYIVSQQLQENGFAGYVNKSQIASMYANGHEIGAHTRTHTALSTKTLAQQQAEIQGSRNDLLAMNVGPINSFAYPFGDYNSTTIEVVKNAGYSSAAATVGGYVLPTSDEYQLERQGITNSTTLAHIKGWVDEAAANKKWLIMTFHEVNTSGHLYAITPTLFSQAVDYIQQKGIPVVTVDQGVQSLK